MENEEGNNQEQSLQDYHLNLIDKAIQSSREQLEKIRSEAKELRREADNHEEHLSKLEQIREKQFEKNKG